MAARYSRKSLAEVTVNNDYDAAAAAAFFGRKVEFIEREQQTPEYRNYVKFFLDRAKTQEINREKKTADDAVAIEKEERIKADATEKEERISAITTEKEERVTEDQNLQNQIDSIDTTDTTKRTARGMTPFSDDRMMGKTYGPMTPYNRREPMMPFHEPMTGKPSGTPMRGRFPKKRESAQDILHHLDGQPELVKEYVWDLIMDRVPELRNADETYNLIFSKIAGYTQPFNPTEKVKLRDIENMATADMSASEIISLLNLLPKGERLNVNWFDGELNIPTNTVEWHGQFQLRTAYESGHMVIDAGNIFIYIRDVPDTNTTRPGDDTTRAEHLDAGSPNDLVNATKSNLTFTLVRRSGDNINLEITNADIVRAFQGMTTTERARVRTALDVPVVNHNHDSRYFTEAEMNTLLAGKSNVGHNHDDRYYTEAEANSRFARRVHNHDDRYYTETEARALFSLLGHNHDGRYYTETESDARFVRLNGDDLTLITSQNPGDLGNVTNRGSLQNRGSIVPRLSEKYTMRLGKWFYYTFLFTVTFNSPVSTDNLRWSRNAKVRRSERNSKLIMDGVSYAHFSNQRSEGEVIGQNTNERTNDARITFKPTGVLDIRSGQSANARVYGYFVIE